MTDLKPGWSQRQFEKAAREIQQWPAWMRKGVSMPRQFTKDDLEVCNHCSHEVWQHNIEDRNDPLHECLLEGCDCRCFIPTGIYHDL